jgi:hypothetical protein
VDVGDLRALKRRERRELSLLAAAKSAQIAQVTPGIDVLASARERLKWSKP